MILPTIINAPQPSHVIFHTHEDNPHSLLVEEPSQDTKVVHLTIRGSDQTTSPCITLNMYIDFSWVPQLLSINMKFLCLIYVLSFHVSIIYLLTIFYHLDRGNAPTTPFTTLLCILSLARILEKGPYPFILPSFHHARGPSTSNHHYPHHSFTISSLSLQSTSSCFINEVQSKPL